MKIKDLPPATVRELCRYLNIEGDGQRNWKELVSRIPGRVYTVYDISAFARAGQRAHTSPADEVIMDLITLGVTVDSLYRILHTMDARQCMEALARHVSPEVIDEVEALRISDVEKTAYQPEPVAGLDPSDPLNNADVHPVYGPLPNPPPPTSSQGVLKQSHHIPHPYQSHTYSSQQNVSQPTGAESLTLQGYGNHGTMNGSSVSPASSSFGGQETDSENRHPSPPFLLSHSYSNVQNWKGTATGTSATVKYHYPSTVTMTANSRKTQSQGGFPHNYPHVLNGVTSTNQQVMKGTPPYHQGNYGSTKQASSSPSWPSSYSGTPSLEQRDYSFHKPSSTNVGVQKPFVHHPAAGGQVISSSSEDTRYSSSGLSSDYTPSGASSSTFISVPGRKEDRSRDEERTFEPNILKFSYAELSEATDGFVKDMVGLGSFGTVFRAKIRGNGPYAIKKLYSEREMGGGVFYEPLYRETFTQELHMLTKYRHQNILSLVAYSSDGPTPCLVYEYMENGSLADCFQGKRKITLLWDLRLKIANQIADALHFLHTVNKPKSVLVHGDVKSANILLDAQLVPKLSDFGLARECSTSANQSTTINTKSDIIMGTMAYLAPEFIRNKKFKPSADVYSFGVVLLELYTGQLALSDDPIHQERVLTTRLANLIDDGSESHHDEVLRTADPKALWPQQTGIEMFDIATVCLRHKPKLRPPMEQVIDQLQLIFPQQTVHLAGHSYDSSYAASWH